MESSGNSKIIIKADADLEDLMPEFLQRRTEDIRLILEAAEKSDFEKLQTIGHQMVGSGSCYGFDYLTELGSVIEREAIAKRPEKFPELAAKLKNYLEKVEIVFE